MSAHEQDTFTEAEVFQALSWGMADSAARHLAKHMADDPTLIASMPDRKEMEPSVTMYSEDMLLLLSLVSEKAHEKAERRLAQQQLRAKLSPEERAEWESRRTELKTRLIKAGKSVPDL
jgi:hypothetical protein